MSTDTNRIGPATSAPHAEQIGKSLWEVAA